MSGTPGFSLRERASGVLLHLTSLPGPHGNGDLGPEARAFVDFLERAGQRWWQMLPVNPVGPGFSPYSGVSAFAGNALLISLHELVEEGLLHAGEIERELSPQHADYAAASELRADALRRAFARFRAQGQHEREPFAEFRQRARAWLPDYALFMALKRARGAGAWTSWEPPLARHEVEAVAEARAALAVEVAFFEFEQFLFDRQWRALRTYAAERGVGLIGDAPIFVAHDSADVWGNQRFFRLDARGEPTVVSGVPPDYFSQTGQRWGTPLYRWKVLERHGYRFWIERLRTLLAHFDVIRLDHFIGFVRYWEIPAEEETAVRGRWLRGPGRELFECARRELGALPFIAEDLGLVTPEVRALRRELELPGMRVLQFGFSGDPRDNEFLPHHYVRRCVAYTGTHDNDTSVGWFEDPGDERGPRTPAEAQRERQAALRYLAGPRGELTLSVHWSMVRALFASVADIAIAPMQDLLGLGSEARMNTPGVGEGNWAWRVHRAALSSELADTLRAFTETYGRLCPHPQRERLAHPGRRRRRGRSCVDVPPLIAARVNARGLSPSRRRQRSRPRVVTTCGSRRKRSSAGRVRGLGIRAGGAEQAHRAPIAFDRTDVKVSIAGAHRGHAPAARDVLVDERADVGVALVALAPEAVQLAQHPSRDTEAAPNPRRARVRLLHLNFAHRPVFIAHDRVEQLRLLDRKQEKAQVISRERAVSLLREPDRVGQTHQHRLVFAHQRQRTKDRVAQAVRARLHDVADLRLSDARLVIADDVRLARRDHEADLIHPRHQHPLDDVLAHGLGPLVPIEQTAADGQELLRKGERLNAAAEACGRDDAPHHAFSV